jgi:hypothetical protein
MQDEPEGKARFQYKMSLKPGLRYQAGRVDAE